MIKLIRTNLQNKQNEKIGYRSKRVMLDNPTYFSPCSDVFSKYCRMCSTHDARSFKRPLLLLQLLVSFQAFTTSGLERRFVMFAISGITTSQHENRTTTDVTEVDSSSKSELY